MLLSRAWPLRGTISTSLFCLSAIPLSRATMSSATPPPPSTSADPPSGSQSPWPRRRYIPRHSSWPYTTRDFDRQDPSSDGEFYAMPRFVTHIDDHAISALGEYYSAVMPRKGKVLDLCSSWISHFPPSLESLSTPSTGSTPQLEVFGLGMSQPELEKNPILSHRIIRDLNVEPTLPDYPGLEDLDAVTCVVSIDYLIHPLPTLQSCLAQMKDGGRIHLVVSNRCFPTKAVRRWLEVDEEERSHMVGDYLHFSGFTEIEIVTLSKGGGGFLNHVDPLWVVTGVKPPVT